MKRTVQLQNEEIYHVFNRGVEKRTIFQREIDYRRFLTIAHLVNSDAPKQLHLSRFFQNGHFPEVSTEVSNIGRDGGRMVEILSWCLMPNHFHILVRQLQENGISLFLQRLQSSHSQYFNNVYKRKGTLFGGRFKAVHVNNDVQYTHVSRYIHLNPLELFDSQWKKRGYVVDKKGAIKFLKGYKWSSFPDYAGDSTQFAALIDKNPIMRYFDNNAARYLEFLQDWIFKEVSSHDFIDFDLSIR